MESYIIYVISISLQVAGALLLVVYAISTKREDVIRRFAGKGIIYRDNETNKITYNKEAFFQEYKMAYISKLSFIYILGGYLLGVLGNLKESNFSEDIALILIAILSLTIMLVSNKCVKCYIIKKNKASEITNDELLKIGIEPDIENITSTEIIEMFNDATKK